PADVPACLQTINTSSHLAAIALVFSFSLPGRLKPAPTRALLFGVVAGSVFFIRNLILTGNPIAPFLTSLAPHVAHYRAGAFLSDSIFDGRFVGGGLGASMLMA